MKQRSSRNVIILSISMIFSSAIIAGGIAYASGETITACVKKSNGATRIISGKMKCTRTERTVTWGQTGPQGATGATGATGAQGIAGADATSIFGVITRTGGIDAARSSSAILAAYKSSTGITEITFDRDIRNCSPVATVFPLVGGFNAAQHVLAFPDNSGVDNTVLTFYTTKADNTFTDVDFSFALYCK